MDFSILWEPSLRTTRLYLRAGSALMIRTGCAVAPNRRDTRRGGIDIEMSYSEHEDDSRLRLGFHAAVRGERVAKKKLHGGKPFEGP
jgi:hypothetical protein